MRTKLGLTNDELMNSSWISLNLQMADFPYYDPKKKKYIRNSFDHLEQLQIFRS